MTHSNLGNTESVIFVQKSYLDTLKDKKVSGEDFTMIVDDSFQYGQDKNKTKRWLVYHDKNNKAYQVCEKPNNSIDSSLILFSGAS